MLVYGDSQYEIETRLVISKLISQLRRIRSSTPNLAAARDFLIACGQLEQGLADLPDNPFESTAVTDLAADLFLALLRARRLSKEAIQRLEHQLNHLLAPTPKKIKIKVPEGFAFYTLYPEQYVLAAETWLKKRLTANALVVGIRSIGTSLSAVVLAVLRAAALETKRITVRPSGHPFSRTVSVPDFSQLFDHALIVDEGPGLSGSSMAAVADSVHKSGIHSITLFPGHPNGPGSAATAEVKRVWKNTPTIVCSLENLLLEERLQQESRKYLRGQNIEFSDLSAGLWRPFLLRNEKHWPSLVPTFERTKFLFRDEFGNGVFWKFAGLGPGRNFESMIDEAVLTQSNLSARGFTTEPLSVLDGFIASRWITGEPLHDTELSDHLIKHIAEYLIASAAPKLDESTSEESLARLHEMIYWNSKETFGDQFADETKEFAESLTTAGDLPAYGDGRMAPHEWIRAGDGQILKTDCWCHQSDHTCVGRQTILWDVAGSILEWRMSPAQVTTFLTELSAGRLSFPDEALRFHLLAYAWFRIGILSIAEGPNVPEESVYFQRSARGLLATSASSDPVQFLNCTS